VAEAALFRRERLAAFTLSLEVGAAIAVDNGHVALAARCDDVEVHHPAVFACNVGVPYGYFGRFGLFVHDVALLRLHSHPDQEGGQEGEVMLHGKDLIDRNNSMDA